MKRNSMKMSESLKKNWQNLEYKKKMSEAHIGQNVWNKGKRGCFTNETLQKMSNSHKGKVTWMKGKKHTKESKEKISKAGIGRFVSEKTKKKKSKSMKKYWLEKKNAK